MKNSEFLIDGTGVIVKDFKKQIYEVQGFSEAIQIYNKECQAVGILDNYIGKQGVVTMSQDRFEIVFEDGNVTEFLDMMISDGYCLEDIFQPLMVWVDFRKKGE